MSDFKTRIEFLNRGIDGLEREEICQNEKRSSWQDKIRTGAKKIWDLTKDLENLATEFYYFAKFGTLEEAEEKMKDMISEGRSAPAAPCSNEDVRTRLKNFLLSQIRKLDLEVKQNEELIRYFNYQVRRSRELSWLIENRWIAALARLAHVVQDLKLEVRRDNGRAEAIFQRHRQHPGRADPRYCGDISCSVKYAK